MNEVICHGIPDSYALQDGDIVNVDVTCYVGGYHGDCSETFLVGNVDEAGKQLVKATYDCWQECDRVLQARPAIQGHRRHYRGGDQTAGLLDRLALLRPRHRQDLPHDAEHPHYKNNEPGKMEVGHVFTIEPMICEGTSKHVEWADDWTATKDGKRSAQFENTRYSSRLTASRLSQVGCRPRTEPGGRNEGRSSQQSSNGRRQEASHAGGHGCPLGAADDAARQAPRRGTCRLLLPRTAERWTIHKRQYTLIDHRAEKEPRILRALMHAH